MKNYCGQPWAFSSVGQSGRLITGWSTVRAREGPPYRGIAQQVEQRSPKPRAEGSIPSAPANANYGAIRFRYINEWRGSSVG